MIFKPGDRAKKNWRKQRGFNDLAKVAQGIEFRDGEAVITTDRNAA